MRRSVKRVRCSRVMGGYIGGGVLVVAGMHRG